ncbi:MAG TPA: type II toxin-antitoxin system VapC family toxin [Candidatus Eisenbacteria bacterium]|nr:type II toxin-antitoxin system VapC family toxin [Candidatus Eisenbacteria bacterium]
MLRFDGQCGGLVFRHIVGGPEAIEDVQTEILAERLDRALAAWDGLWAQVAPVLLDEPLAKMAGQLARVHALRGADAVHLAAAQATGSDLLLSADRQLCAAAQRCGLGVIDLDQAT